MHLIELGILTVGTTFPYFVGACLEFLQTVRPIGKVRRREVDWRCPDYPVKRDSRLCPMINENKTSQNKRRPSLDVFLPTASVLKIPTALT